MPSLVGSELCIRDRIVLTPFVDLFEERYIGILIADALGISVIILFTCINWTLLLTQRKFKLTRPKIWKL